MNIKQLLEQHDRAKQLLLEGGSLAGYEEHVKSCAICAPLAVRLAQLDRLIGEVPAPRPELLRQVLRPRRASVETATPAGRIEMLWPTSLPSASSMANAALPPLVLVVDADHDSHSVDWHQMERFIIVGRHPIIVGRGPDIDIPIWDRSVSRRHAEIDWREQTWRLRDLESTNGTKVNGARLDEFATSHLSPGDEIEVGSHARMTVRSLLPAIDPAGIARELHRMLAWTIQTTGTSGRRDRVSESIRERLVGLREETVRLRDQLSMIAGSRLEAEALPKVYKGLDELLALLEHEAR